MPFKPVPAKLQNPVKPLLALSGPLDWPALDYGAA